MKKVQKNLRKKVLTIITIALLVLVSFVITALPSKADFVSGSATIYPCQNVEPCANYTWTITYTIGLVGNTTKYACGEGIDGGTINVTIPLNWSLPQVTDPTLEGFVVVKPQYSSGIVFGEITVTGRNISIPIISGSNRGERIYIIYGEMSGGLGPGAQAQCFVQRGVEFSVWENPNKDPNNWRKLTSSPKLNVVDYIDNIDGIFGITNISTTQGIGVNNILFHGWTHEDDTAIAVIAEDSLSYTIGMQLNNGDEYQDPSQHIKITFHSLAKTDMIVKLRTELSITNPDQADEATDNIHIWYKGDGSENEIGQIDPWSYLIKIPGMPDGKAGKTTIQMCVNVGNTVEPGFYTFQTYIEPTNWEEINSVNMG